MLPASLAELLDPLVAQTSESIWREMVARPPMCTMPDSTFLREGARLLIELFISGIRDGRPPGPERLEVCWSLGRRLCHHRVAVEVVRCCLAVATKVVWQHVAAVNAGRHLDSAALARLGVQVLDYMDEVATEVVTAYKETAARISDRQRCRRQQLLEAVLTEDFAGSALVRELAERNDWPLPSTIAAVALADPGVGQHRLLMLPPDVLIDVDRRRPVLLVPDPDGPGRAALLARTLRGWTAAVGPTVSLHQAGQSLGWARDLLAVTTVDAGLVHCTDHLSTLMLLRDKDLARLLVRTRLAPLLALRADKQELLAETLSHWLRSGQDTESVAARLYVHAQTVRNRIRQLRVLFGPALVEPRARLELMMALSARKLLPAHRD
ncbi:PucR family transcriptional regulator [Crossiella cryophila]